MIFSFSTLLESASHINIANENTSDENEYSHCERTSGANLELI